MRVSPQLVMVFPSYCSPYAGVLSVFILLSSWACCHNSCEFISATAPQYNFFYFFSCYAPCLALTIELASPCLLPLSPWGRGVICKFHVELSTSHALFLPCWQTNWGTLGSLGTCWIYIIPEFWSRKYLHS